VLTLRRLAAPAVLAAFVVVGCHHDKAPRATARGGAAAAAAAKGAAARIAGRRFIDELDVKVFQRGNIHTHSLESDGKSPPRDVYEWYKNHGYNFLAMTDHNTLTEPKRFKALETSKFIIIPGEEVTMDVSETKVPVHVNALCEHKQVGPGFHHAKGLTDFPSIAAALQWSIKSIVAAKGIALVNHPNYKWSFGIEALPGAKGATLLEIFNGQPGVHSLGDGHRPSEEAIWDEAYLRGMKFGAVAVDDMHHMQESSGSGPGRGWVRVFSTELTRAAICDGLAKSRLYASNGGELRRFQVTPAAMSVWPDEDNAKVEFVAPGNHVIQTLRVALGTPATYRIVGNEGAVRARITTSRGTAWTQFYEISK
jgi:hypothetical protein